MPSYKLDVDVMEVEFLRRYRENLGKQIDNASLHAGSPMYYYCHGCGIHVATLPEGWFGSLPARHCDACKILLDYGMLDRLRQEAKEECQAQKD